MPDLITVIMSQCKSLSKSFAEVGGYFQNGMGDERCYPTCTCPAYKFGKRTVNFGGRMYPEFCKHIIQAQEEICGWHEQYSQEVQTKKGICPRCGNETEYVKVGV